jgi:hypothetical protein
MRTTPLAGGPVLAGDITGWITSNVNWLSGILPVIFLVGVFGIGVWLLIATRGMFRKLFVFVIGAAIIYMLLTRIPAIADKFGTEVTKPGGLPAPTVVHQPGHGQGPL